MANRTLLLAAVMLLLAGCNGSGNPAYYSTAGGASPYDYADKFLDPQGFPLPGWGNVRSGGGPK